MTEISTKEVNLVELMSDDRNDSSDDLEPHEKYFYKSISSQLNQIRFSPKKETVLAILAYSKSKR
ncbi:MAG: hypothetical protein EOP42_06215 [Sphingobacteriaceae bacterium]|nr:MAG: hypothetical protein EOP42_06215 [Sphingobacteriaceae bacterium]